MKSYLVSGNLNCFLDAHLNIIHFNKDKLHIVVGSLGIGKGNNVYYEYGGLGKEYKCIENIIPNDQHSGFDAHVWLEDEKGRVYDACRFEFILISKLWGKSIDFKNPCSFIAKTKNELKEKGLVYIPFDKDIQCNVIWLYRKLYNVTTKAIIDIYNKDF